MDFLMNDLSLHGQFGTSTEFYDAVDTVMKIRATIRKGGRELFCHRSLAAAQVTADQTMAQAIQGLNQNAQRAWIQWLTKGGPFWVEQRQHGEDEWLEIENGTIVTDTGVGEAAYCLLHNLPRETVSFAPSSWLQDPISVTWRKSHEEQSLIDVPNHWAEGTIRQRLATLPLPFHSWKTLEGHLRATCEHLTFGKDFMRLEGYPYVRSVGEWIYILVDVLNRMSGAFDEHGAKTNEYEELYSAYFKGQDPYFSDESTQNKNDYEQQMTFPHPGQKGVRVFCPWHGKVNSPKNFPPVRVHFSWPISAKDEVYLAYVGKKITMK
jgi:hypothetical protein